MALPTVSSPLPSVTIIVPARPGDSEIRALAAVQRLDYPRDRLELIVARGRQPSVQRNAAIRVAVGDLIYFLDDDSEPAALNLRRAAPHFADPAVKIVGGPNVCPPSAPLLERVFGVVLSSWIAFGPSRARYAPVGTVRASGEKELILCNLLARRDAILDAGGFDEQLYPNEENALMDELVARGGRLLYDPGFVVHRRPRSSLGAFARMLMSYGRGRAEQFRLHPSAGSLLNMVPPLFTYYVLLVLLAIPWLARMHYLPLVPIAAYLVALLAQTGWSMSRNGIGVSLLALPLLGFTHACYGVGFWRGLVTRPKPPSEETTNAVRLESVPL